MNTIRLSQGDFTIVDEEDFEFLSQWKWHKDNGGYAARKPGKKVIRMHYLLHPVPKGMQTDHINGNKLDNRKCNFRTATNQQNCWNTGPRRNNKTGFKGVIWRSDKKKFLAVIEHNRKQIFLGYHTTAEDAHFAHTKKAQELRGQFVPL